jgi:hypothetical protein
VNLLQKLLNIGKSSGTKVTLKRTPEMQAAISRIEARKQQEQSEAVARERHERRFKSSEQLAREVTESATHSTADEHLRQLRRNGQRKHNDRLETDSGLMANSKMDLWLNTITPQEAPDTIAPDLRIPDTVFNVETNSFTEESEPSKSTTEASNHSFSAIILTPPA